MPNLNTALAAYIQKKKRLERFELRDGARGDLTFNRLLNPQQMLETLGALWKNPDPLMSIEYRRRNLAHAEYLYRLINHPDTSEEQISKEVNLQLQSASLDKNSSYYKLLGENAPDSNIQGNQSQETQTLRELWIYFLYSKVSDEFLPGGNYSFGNFVFNALHFSIDFSSPQAELDKAFEEVFQHITNGYCVGYNPQAQASVIKPADLSGLSQSRRKHSIPEAGIGLKPVILASDRIMRMQLHNDRFAEWTIQGFDQDQPIGYESRPLPDGWYQYVIVTDPQSQFRYFPCSPQKSGYIPYAKYVSHSEIAGEQNIYAAGGFKVESGRITLIDNSSGHFKTNATHVEYAKDVLTALGSTTASELKPTIMPEMTGKSLQNKLTKKVNATLYGAASSASSQATDKQHTIAAAAEERPIAPKALRGRHLFNSQADDRIQFYQSQMNLRGYAIERSIHEKDSVNGPITPRMERMEIIAPLAKYAHDQSKIDAWVSSIVLRLLPNPDFNHYLLVIKDFPPQAHQYYLALQNKIKDIESEECRRPNIIVQFKGTSATEEKARVGLIGGTGPLSDAVLTDTWLGSGEIKDIEAVNAVLLSFPPPRKPFDTPDQWARLNRYSWLLSTYTALYAAKHHFLLSNTAHMNIHSAGMIISKNTGPIVNMVERIANDIAESDQRTKSILVLGTQAAADAQLYPKIINPKDRCQAILPDAKAQAELQRIIDATKNGKATEVGETFITLLRSLLDQAAPKPTHIILSCTELPLLLNTTVNGKAFRDKFMELMGESKIAVIDTEHRFIEIITEYHEPVRTIAASLQAESSDSRFAQVFKSSALAAIAIGAGSALTYAISFLSSFAAGASITVAHGMATALVTAAAVALWPVAVGIIAATMIGAGLVYFTKEKSPHTTVEQEQDYKRYGITLNSATNRQIIMSRMRRNSTGSLLLNKSEPSEIDSAPSRRHSIH